MPGEQGGSSKLVSRVAVASWRGSSHSCLQKRGWWAGRIGMEEKRGWEDWEVGRELLTKRIKEKGEPVGSAGSGQGSGQA